jgi:hypothetical protein
MIYGTVTARIDMSDGTGTSFSLTSMGDVELERRFKAEIEKFFSDRKRKPRWQTPKKRKFAR